MLSKEGDIGRLEEQFGSRFACLPRAWFRSDVSSFRDADPDDRNSLDSFWISTVSLGSAAATRIPVVDNESRVFVCVPRGSYPLTWGARESFPDAPLIITNDGAHKTIGPLMSNEVPDQHVGSLIIVDSVLDQGGTLDRTIAACDGRISAEQIVMLTVIAHPPTVERVLNQYPTLHIITADTESNFTPAKVGTGNWLAGFGDIGGLVEAYAHVFQRQDLMPPPGWYPRGY
ncbi:MAG: uracil phosphoribosyltransferase [Candidatus Gottesmanbacteria bacterium]|nr:uracil phosphoribosyltransferase [Candidatus Gottesmanbacteria bacterium]